jgi:hypothetical protein
LKIVMPVKTLPNKEYAVGRGLRRRIEEIQKNEV